MAVAAIPQVLKRGIVAGEHADHKYRGFQTVTFAAPVEINGMRGNMAVVVKQESRNVYKTHRILMPDGSTFEYNNNAEPSTARGVARNGSYASPISSASTSIVAENPENIKFSLRAPVEFADDDDVKFSVRTLSDGTQYTLVDATEIDADGITDADSIGKKARIYMRQKYKGVVLPAGATKSAYIRRDGINEYTNPRKFLSNEDYSSKMVAATELENLLRASSYLRWAKDDGHHPEAVRGWTYWRTVFAVKDADSEALKVFQGDVQIMRIARGDVFHDITQIKEITNDTIGQSIVMDAKFVGDGGSIAQPDDSVKFSPRDAAEFADDGDVKYSVRDNSDEVKSIKQQIATHADELNAMTPVAKKTVRLPKDGALKR